MLTALAAWHAARPEWGRRAIRALFASAAAAWVYGLVVFVRHGASFAARARGPVGHYMTFGGQIALITSLAIGIAWTARGRERLLPLAVTLLGLVTLAATYTRSAWIGLVAALATMLAVTRPRWLAGLAALAIALYWIAPGAYHDRIHSIFDPHHPTNVERTYMWEAGLHMFRDHPLTGVGLEDLKPVYDRYRLPGAHERAGHLHSVPVQVLATMGAVGLIAFIVLYAGIVRCAASGLRLTLARARESAFEDDRLAAGLRLGALGAAVSLLAAGFFEWTFGDEELLYVLYLLAGIAWAARAWPRARPALVAEPEAAFAREALP